VQSKRQHPTTKKVLRQLKQTQYVSIVERMAISPIDAPKTKEIKMFKAPQPHRLQPKTQRAKSATIMDRRVTLLFNAATHMLTLF
jgi:hypothetical protein